MDEGLRTAAEIRQLSDRPHTNSNDGRYWVYAEFSVSAPGLPEGGEPEVLPGDEKNYLLSWNTKKFQNYLCPVVAKLETVPADKFQPNLELLEHLIQSLEVHPS